MLLTQDDLLHYYPHYTGEGSFVARAFVADGAYPVPQVKVTVYACLPDNIWKPYRILFTDENGETAPLPLPAPDKSASAAPPLPQAAPPFAVYRATAEKEGYNTIQVDSIPVFDSITSRQNFPLIPLSDPAGFTTVQTDEGATSEPQIDTSSRTDILDMQDETSVSETETVTSSEMPSGQMQESMITDTPQTLSEDMIQNIAQSIAQNFDRQLTMEELQYFTQEALKNLGQSNTSCANDRNDETSFIPNTNSIQDETNEDTDETAEKQEQTETQTNPSFNGMEQELENDIDNVEMKRNTQSTLLDPDDTGSADATYENLQQPE